jgi:streptogramin lyase
MRLTPSADPLARLPLLLILLVSTESLRAQAITEFPLDRPGAYPVFIRVGPDRNLWVVDTLGIERITVAGAVTAFPNFEIPLQSFTSMILGPDSNFWFTRYYANIGRPYPVINTVGRITLDGNVKEFQLSNFSFPTDIVVGPDGNLWFTEPGVYKIGRITPSGYLSEFEALGGPTMITVGPDGNLWFTEEYQDMIGRVSPSGQVNEFPLNKRNVQPFAIVAGPDGNVWFTEFHGESVGRITPSGKIDEFRLSIPTYEPSNIIVGPDGNLWFTEGNWYTSENSEVTGGIGRITTAGVITEFPLPSSSSPPVPLISGPDGNLWFTEPGFSGPGRTIGRITTDGLITEFATPDPNGRPHDLVAGPDGNIWFAETEVGRITTAAGLQVPALPPRPGHLHVLGSRPRF